VSAVVCTECGHRFSRRSRFEEDCPECGEESLVEEDAYHAEPLQLRCAECGHEVDGAPPGTTFAAESGRYTVDDPCALCGRLELTDRAMAKRGSRDAPEFHLARAVARRLVNEYWNGRPPVDVEDISRAAGLDVRIGGFDHDGQLVDHIIEVPKTSAAAERFVIAHELGHFELRHKVPEARIEQEANAFASELLIPTVALRAAMRANPSLAELSRQFAVSRQTMTYALESARLLSSVRPR
jgi:predicted RNA-binding Zn-ribbon protein involved in translation (DUF1610 family)